jgi:hypothetical protein
MTYDVFAEPIEDELYRVEVVVREEETELLRGVTQVCGTESDARNYAETVFLPDLRNLYSRKIGELVLESEKPVEPVGEVV